ncbi:MAG: hypothetical protein R8G33_06915 [Gammaproteobacteria bacterium]|nr:hypothetical protein [Gammaproteobacteria bacterium]
MNKAKLIFRSLNIIWIIIGIFVVVILATSTKGHPPGIIFAPIAIVIWIFGHVLLWISHKLAIKGEQLAGIKVKEGSSWPITLVLLAIFLGAVCIFGLFGIILKIMFEHNWQSKLPTMLVFWFPPSVCFVGILLRKSWSRIMAGSGFIVAAMFLIYQMIESLIHSHKHSALEWLAAIVVLVICLFLGQHILRSSRFREFYSK